MPPQKYLFSPIRVRVRIKVCLFVFFFFHLQMNPDETGLAMSVIASNISASSNLASLSIALSSLIGAWAGSTSSIFTTSIIYGSSSQTIASVKYIALLICFLAAFTCFIQSTRQATLFSFFEIKMRIKIT